MCPTMSSNVRNLLDYSPEEVQQFLDSFDKILCDCDGVLWHVVASIDGSMNSVKKLAQLGKHVYLVTNNSLAKPEQFCRKVQKYGHDISPKDVITTAKAVIWYLKKINFQGKAFVIASKAFCEMLTEAGFELAESNTTVSESDVLGTIKNIEDFTAIDAVITDVDVHIDWSKLAIAVNNLCNRDILFVSGATDEWVLYDDKRKILGPGPLTNIISRQTGKSPIECGKPSEVLKEFVFEAFDIKDPSRCLFVGDTIQQDMKFATLCGFQKLFVGTGCDNIEQAQKYEDIRPDYYIPSFAQISSLIDSTKCDLKTHNNN